VTNKSDVDSWIDRFMTNLAGRYSASGVPVYTGVMLKTRALPLWIIGLGLALRIYAAVSHLDISHPDEHFQTLEPASHVVYGFGWLSWEWTTGTRSWLIPALYMPLLWVFKLLGFNGGPAPIIGCRVMMALLSTLMLGEFWVLLRESGFKRVASLIALAFFALSPACAAWGAMTLSDCWAMIFLWCAMPRVLRSIEKNGEEKSGETTRDGYLTGALLGLSFLARIQMALWPIGILLVLALRRPFPWKFVRSAMLGYVGVMLFQGALDWVTWGSPFHSVIANIQKNLMENVASFYGTSPFYDYFQSVPKQLGVVAMLAIGLPVLWALVMRRARFREREALIAVPALLYLLVHSAIAHKELRFMFPMIPALFYLMAWGLSSIETQWKLREDLFGGVCLLLAVASCGAVYSNDHTYLFDLSELTQKIREDGGLKNGGCLILLDHYWIWTRGEMMIGAPIHSIEVSSSRPLSSLPPEVQHCAYAITLPGREQWFRQPGGPPWQEFAKDGHGQYLMKYIGP
jgi:hypothetical protein